MNNEDKKYGDYYRIGLDLGIASVGWACMACDSHGDAKHILDLGVRTFDMLEEGSNGETPASQRRLKRSARRRLRRGQHRLERARELFGVEKEDPRDYEKGYRPPDVYELRVKALDEKIAERDFVRVLMLILKRRGYKSNSRREMRDGEDPKEREKVKTALDRNKKLMDEKAYRTVGELLYREYSTVVDGRRRYDVRNHNDYDKCVTRELLADEVKKLFAAQRKFGGKLASEEYEKKFLEIFTAQRNFDEGPGKGSPYTATFKVGISPFEKQPRIPKSTYTFEYFRVLQSINHLRICTHGTERFLTQEERAKALEHCMQKESVKYCDLRKILKLDDGESFYGLNYRVKKKKSKQGNDTSEEQPSDKEIIKKTEEKRFCAIPACYQIRKKLEEKNKGNTALIDEIGRILTYYKSEERISEEFNNSETCAVLTGLEREKLIELNFSGFGHLCKSELDKVIPYLEQGLIYSEAMEKAGYDHASPNKGDEKTIKFNVNKEDFQEEFSDITSPTVRRAVSQAIKVLNAIIDRYGSPVAINIELAREMGKSKKERDEIKKENDDRNYNNESMMNEIKEFFGIVSPTGQDLVKYRLYKEQEGKSIYSGKQLDLDLVMHDKGYVQVDHIIPYSRCFCDAQYNKVLVLSSENQQKGNRIPKEYLGDGEEWDNFCARVRSLKNISRKKKETLLREKFTKENGKDWKDRNLVDTQYIASFLHNQLQRRLKFADCDMGVKRVFAVKGAVTAIARRLWGIQKVREDGDLHHALDAVVIACISNGFTQSLTRWAKRGEAKYMPAALPIIDYETGEVISRGDLEDFPKRLPMPHAEFRKELEMRLSNNPTLYNDEYFKFGYDSTEINFVRSVFVSRAPNRKAKGAIHLETVYSYDEDLETVTLKTPLYKLKLKNGEIEGYNEKARQSDTILYEALKRKLEEFGGNGEKAFAEEFHKPKADGTQGPLVKKVLIDQNISAPVKLDRGRAKNDRMVRVDIFRKNFKDGYKYYGVPVYVSDIYKGVIPNKAAVAGKSEEEWLEMTEEYEFMFALYKNDLIKIGNKKGIYFSPQNDERKKIKLNEEIIYYKGFNRAIAAITTMFHDNSYLAENIGIQKLTLFEKWEVDILGNCHKVKSEKRPPAQMKRKK